MARISRPTAAAPGRTDPLLWRRWLTGLAVAAGLIWLNNTSLFLPVDPSIQPKILSHRGVHQRYIGPPPDLRACTASPIAAAEHRYIENTVPSMQAAFDLGADVVELDVHLTPDGVFAVFHDWTLECRTDGAGQTNKTSFADLQKLDVGYRYSPDGKTFPLRGTGVGQIPALTDVLTTFPDGSFLINFKSNRAGEGQALLDLLAANPQFRRQIFGVYGGAAPTEAVMQGAPQIPGFHWNGIRSCLLRYVATGWLGIVPHHCRKGIVMVPTSHARWLWGWPHRFTARMARAGVTVVLVGPYEGGRHVQGIDSGGTLGAVPEGFQGYLWTNDLPALREALGM